MTGVRNGCLGRLITAGGTFESVFTVPGGETVLLKAIHLLNSGSVDANVQVQLTDSTNTIAALLVFELLATSKHFTWEGWTALNPGDHLRVFSDKPGVHVWSAGAALPGIMSTLPK